MAEDWTVAGKDYHNVKVTSITDDSVAVTYDGGIGHFSLAASKKAANRSMIECTVDSTPIIDTLRGKREVGVADHVWSLEEVVALLN